MIWNDHSNLKGTHAPFSPSQSSWLRYSNDEIIDRAVFQNSRTLIGTEIHEFACDQILLHNKIPSVKWCINSISSYIYCKYKNSNGNLDYAKDLIEKLQYIEPEVYDTVRMYVNDGVTYRMTPEQELYFSEYFYGTTDSISFNNDKLRIHDLKTGLRPAHIEQLLVYAALFCLEYKIDPQKIDMDLRVYQFGEINDYTPNAEEITEIMDKIKDSNMIIVNAIKEK